MTETTIKINDGENLNLSLGIICLNSKSSLMVKKEAEKYFTKVDMIDLRKIEIFVDKNIKVLYDGEELKKYDCLYVKGSYRYANLLYCITEAYKDSCFIPNDSSAHIIAHNKFMTHLLLAQNKRLRMPETYFAAKINETKRFLKTLNYPIIIKFPTGTHGKGVIFTESYISASSMIDALDVFKQPAIIQNYIPIKSDIRIIVAGNHIIGSMRRISKSDDIRANAHQGGNAEPYIPTPEIKQISLEAAKILKANICAIDIIESAYGPLILEVNISPGLQKITEVTKRNIADEIGQYLYKKTRKIKINKNKVKTGNIMSNLGIEEIGIRDFEITLDVSSGKITLPKFATELSHLTKNSKVTLKISKNKIELSKNNKID